LALASHGIVQLRKHFEYDESAMEQLLDSSIWEDFREKLISNLADCYAASATFAVVSPATTQDNAANESYNQFMSAPTTIYSKSNQRLIRSERIRSGGPDSMASFFYIFVRAFVEQFHTSTIRPDDVEGVKVTDEANMAEWLMSRQCETEENIAREYPDPDEDDSSELDEDDTSKTSETEEDDSSSNSAGSNSDEST
jgi:hypothetical protein